MLAIDDVAINPQMISDSVAVRINGQWFVATDRGRHLNAAALEKKWEECAPPKPTVSTI
jgi:hypothetical protein